MTVQSCPTCGVPRTTLLLVEEALEFYGEGDDPFASSEWGQRVMDDDGQQARAALMMFRHSLAERVELGLACPCGSHDVGWLPSLGRVKCFTCGSLSSRAEAEEAGRAPRSDEAAIGLFPQSVRRLGRHLREVDEAHARIAELEVERKALCAAMNSAAGEIVNGADRHKIADALLSPDAVRQWLKADDEECEKTERLEAELAEVNGARNDALRRNRENRARYRAMLHQRNEARERADQLREALEAVLRFPPGGVDDDGVPELRGQSVEAWVRARVALDASREDEEAA